MAERPEDLNLPSAVVSRIVKDALPPGTKVSKEAQAAIAKAASVFVLYATSCSNESATKSNRKTIHGQDVINAMEDMEFHKFVRPLEASLENWKQSQQQKKDSAKKKVSDKKDEGQEPTSSHTPSKKSDQSKSGGGSTTQMSSGEDVAKDDDKENDDSEDAPMVE